MTSQDKAERTYTIYRKARDLRGYTDFLVAKLSGVRPSSICDWKHRRYTPKIDKLYAISKVLEIPVEMFLDCLNEESK